LSGSPNFQLSSYEFCHFSLIVLQTQKTQKLTKTLENNKAKGLTSANQGVQIHNIWHSSHIGKLIEKQTSQEMENNRLRLKTSIDNVRWLAFQACAFRGHDESADSKNQGNFIELIKFLATFNDKLILLY
jgi:glycerol kinase